MTRSTTAYLPLLLCLLTHPASSQALAPAVVRLAVGDVARRPLIGLDPRQTEFDKIGKQAGEADHLLTIPEMPTHDHTDGVVQARFAYLDSKNTMDSDIDNSVGEPNLLKTAAVKAQRGSQPHNNLQPYTVLSAKVWVGF
jgi:microcystin-dependent protein